MVYVDKFESVWDWHGSFYRPLVSEGYHALGYVGQKGHGAARGFTFAAREFEPSALAAPVDYSFVWWDKGTGVAGDHAFWKPIPPPGYVCLGLVEWNHIKPPLDLIRCVR